jgi:hypothetical protein
LQETGRISPSKRQNKKAAAEALEKLSNPGDVAE